MILLAFLCYDHLIDLDQLAFQNPNIQTETSARARLINEQLELLLHDMGEYALESLVEAYDFAFVKLIRANLRFIGTMINQSCPAAINDIFDVGHLAFRRYASNYLRFLRPIERKTSFPSDFPWSSDRRIVHSLELRMRRPNGHKDIHEFFPYLDRPRIMRLFKHALQRPSIVKELPDAPVYLAIAEFRDSDGSDESVEKLLSVCEEHFNVSDLAKNVIAITHIFNFTQTPNYDRAADILLNLESTNDDALVVILYLLMDPYNPIAKKIELSTEWWEMRKNRLPSVVSDFFTAMMGASGYDVNADCEWNYEHIRAFIDVSWMMSTGWEAERNFDEGDLMEAYLLYAACALIGNRNATYNAFLLNVYDKAWNPWLPLFAADGGELIHLASFVEGKNVTEVYQSLSSVNSDAALRFALRNLGNYEVANPLLEDILKKRPGTFLLITPLQWIVGLRSTIEAIAPSAILELGIVAAIALFVYLRIPSLTEY